MSTTTADIKPRTFYVQGTPGLAIPLNAPERVLENGSSKIIHGDYLEFQPMGLNSDFGMLTTTNPEAIAVLEKRKDVFGPEEFSRRIQPDDVKIKRLQTENTRVVSENNRLLAKIREMEAAKAAPDPAASGNRLVK